MKLQTVEPAAFPTRCSYRTSSGRQCRLAIFDPQSGLCANHPTRSKTNGLTSPTSSSGMPKTSKPLRESTNLCAAYTGLSARTASLLVVPMPSPIFAACFCAHCPSWPRRERLELPTSLIHLSPTRTRSRHDRCNRLPLCGKLAGLYRGEE